jgi:hypothetical protein
MLLDPVLLGYPDEYRTYSLVLGRERRVLVVSGMGDELVRYSDVRFGADWYNIEIQPARGVAFARTTGRMATTTPEVALASDELAQPRRIAELVMATCGQRG